MPGNRLSQVSDRLSYFLKETLKEEARDAGFILVLVDMKNLSDYTIADNFSRPELTRADVLNAVAFAESERPVSPILPPDMFDATGGVLPRAGLRSLPSGRKLD
jgi:hypothetical protein